MKKLSVCLLVLSLAACGQYEPIAAPGFDGRYVGSRQSNDPDLCGVNTLRGTTSAQVTNGHLSLYLFGPDTELVGTVGAGGRVRASGIWRPPHAHYPQVTILHGVISDDLLAGTASDFRCSTDLRLHKIVVQPHPPLPQNQHPKPHRSPHKPGHSKHHKSTGAMKAHAVTPHSPTRPAPNRDLRR